MFSAKVNDFLESRTPSGGPPSDLEWPGFPTPQPGKTKYSSLSQISLRINKKSNVTLLVPLSPLVTSPNIRCHLTLEWTLSQGLESSIPHIILWIPTYALIWILHIDIFPCEKQSCASLEKFLHELWSHTWCTEVIPVEGKCVSPQG